MADKEAILNALKQAMAGSGAPSKSLRPKMRPNGSGESGRNISNADREMLQMLGSGDSRATRGIPPEQNYSEEDLMRLLMSAGAKSGKKPAGFMGGGEVQQYKSGGAVRKKNGCVMKGRGGKYKGMK